MRGSQSETPQRLSRQHALAIAVAQDRHHPFAEALGLLIVQVARQAERMAAKVDEVLKGLGALLGRADDGDARARPYLGDAGEQVALDDLAARRELAHAAIGLRGGEALLHESLLRLAGMTHQLVRERPGLLLGLAAD